MLWIMSDRLTPCTWIPTGLTATPSLVDSTGCSWRRVATRTPSGGQQLVGSGFRRIPYKNPSTGQLTQPGTTIQSAALAGTKPTPMLDLSASDCQQKQNGKKPRVGMPQRSVAIPIPGEKHQPTLTDVTTTMLLDKQHQWMPIQMVKVPMAATTCWVMSGSGHRVGSTPTRDLRATLTGAIPKLISTGSTECLKVAAGQPALGRYVRASVTGTIQASAKFWQVFAVPVGPICRNSIRGYPKNSCVHFTSCIILIKLLMNVCRGGF